MIFVRAVAEAPQGQLPFGTRQMYERAELGNRDSQTPREHPRSIRKRAWASSSRDLASNPNQRFADAVTLGIFISPLDLLVPPPEKWCCSFPLQVAVKNEMKPRTPIHPPYPLPFSSL